MFDYGGLNGVDELLDVSFNTDASKRALWEACYNRRTDVVRELLESGVDPDTTAINGENVLHIAARHNVIEAVRMLLAHGAQISTPDSTGRTPFYMAARGSNTAIMALLMKHGADPYTPDNTGQTPLELARRLNYQIVLDFFEEIDATK